MADEYADAGYPATGTRRRAHGDRDAVRLTAAPTLIDKTDQGGLDRGRP
jgi:hypothetical protein